MISNIIISNPKDNFIKWKGISRKPTKKQLIEKKYTLPNLRYFFSTVLRNNEMPTNEDELAKIFPENYTNIITSLKKNLGDDAVLSNLIKKL